MEDETHRPRRAVEVWPSSQDTGAIGGGVSRYYKAGAGYDLYA